MSNATIISKTAVELSRSLSEKELSSQEVAQAYLEQIDRVDPQVHAFLHRDDDDFLAQANASDKRRAEGNTLGPLDGIPVAIKDVISVQGQPLTAASKILENYISPYDATVIRKLKDAGAVIGGRLNLDEFAMGSSTENSAYGPTRNPWDFNRVPGGSSGGSSAAVASREAPLTLGSDTGGSIRQPASLCGVVGVKPTYGMVSRYGLAAFASSLDQIGPFSQTVEDAALLLETISGHDPLDSTSFPTEVPQYSAALRDPLTPCTLGLPKEFFGEGIDDEVRKGIEDLNKVISSLPISDSVVFDFIGEIPIVQSIREAADVGRPAALQDGTEIEKSLVEVTQNLVAQLLKRNTTLPPTKAVKITNMVGCSAIK